MDNRNRYILLSLTMIILSVTVRSDQSFLKLPSESSVFSSVDSVDYCESWKFTVENNDAGNWPLVPMQCKEYVKKYMTGNRYFFDSWFVANSSLAFAKSVAKRLSVGKSHNCWVFDVDDTLISSLDYYKNHGYGTEPRNDTAIGEWIRNENPSAIPTSLALYAQLQKLGFQIILLTGRAVTLEADTERQLRSAGYANWTQLILKGEGNATENLSFKSEMRSRLKCRIRGSSGDQWSDLLGKASAQRSFKLPNPMYYVA